MKALVIYNSKTGFTKRYAQWIGEDAGCECVDFKEGAKRNLSDYDAVVFGGWCMAGGITKVSWLKKKIPELSRAGKKIIVFAVGASPADSPDIPEGMRNNFSEEEWKSVKVFYCPGGLDYSRMNFMSRTLMGMLAKSLSKKKDATESDRKKAEMISRSYDISDRKYIVPIVSEIK